MSDREREQIDCPTCGQSVNPDMAVYDDLVARGEHADSYQDWPVEREAQVMEIRFLWRTARITLLIDYEERRYEWSWQWI